MESRVWSHTTVCTCATEPMSRGGIKSDVPECRGLVHDLGSLVICRCGDPQQPLQDLGLEVVLLGHCLIEGHQ